MKNNNYCYFLISFILVSCAPSPKVNRIEEEKAIQLLLDQERKAHFSRDADLFVSEFTDSMIGVNKGKVSVLSRGQNKERIRPYFESVKFIKWDDMAPPVIRISDDGKMAYAVVQKEVIVSYPDSTGKSLIDTTKYAWVSVYRKMKGEWKVELNVSTNK
jgi:hypothetical protein